MNLDTLIGIAVTAGALLVLAGAVFAKPSRWRHGGSGDSGGLTYSIDGDGRHDAASGSDNEGGSDGGGDGGGD